MSDFSDYLSSLTGGSGTTFAPGSATPYATGITQNVLSGSVNVGMTPASRMVGGEPMPTMTMQTISVAQAAMALYGLRPDEIRALQDKLISAGYVTSKDITTAGVVDGATAKAYGDLLQDTSAYNAAGNAMTVNDLLTQRSTARTAAGASSTGGDAQQYETTLHTLTPTDPARLRLTVEAAFKDALGRKPKPEEAARFVASFGAQEQQSQQTGFNAQDQIRSDYIARSTGATAAPASSGTDFAGSEQLAAFIAAAPGAITVTSGTRSRAEQQKLYDAYKAGTGNLAAAPGHSKHEEGLAADLHFANAKTEQWAHANAARFGIHFPVRGEAWHAEPINTNGVQAAAAVAPTPIGGQAPVSQTITVNQPDAGAQAVEYARNANPAETQAYDIGQQFQNFIQIMKQGVI